METAMLAAGLSSDRLIPDDRLKEISFGPFEGQKWETMNPGNLSCHDV
jgi:broad specificity phosphatase PhoE